MTPWRSCRHIKQFSQNGVGLGHRMAVTGSMWQIQGLPGCYRVHFATFQFAMCDPVTAILHVDPVMCDHCIKLHSQWVNQFCVCGCVCVCVCVGGGVVMWKPINTKNSLLVEVPGILDLTLKGPGGGWGGGGPPPPLDVSRDNFVKIISAPQAFMTFFFEVLRNFWRNFRKNRAYGS